MADAVAHEGLPALDEVDADGGGRDADQDGGEQCPLHEGVVQEVHQLSSPVRIVSAPAGAWGCTWSWPGRACWPTAGVGGPSCRTQPSRRTTARSISGS